jgi:hypothetical protein
MDEWSLTVQRSRTVHWPRTVHTQRGRNETQGMRSHPSRTACPVWSAQIVGSNPSKRIRTNRGRLAQRATEMPLEAIMAVIFLVLAAVVGVVLGDTVLENTGPGSVEIFNRSITDLTHGQLLVVAAGLGFLFAFFLWLSLSSSVNRRAKRRERRIVHRDLESRVHELERENVDLRGELDRTPAPAGRVSEPVPPVGPHEQHDGERTSLRDRFRRGDRVEEPARPER